MTEFEHVNLYEYQHRESRQLAKEQILNLNAQVKQRQGFNKSKKLFYAYNIDKVVEIKRTQYLPISKLCKMSWKRIV